MFDFSDASEPTSNSFELIPDTQENFTITGANWEKNKNGDKEKFALEFTVIGGEYDKRRIWQDLWLVSSNPAYAKRVYVEIMAAINNVEYQHQKDNMGQMSKESMVESVLGKQITANIYTQKANGDFPAKNQVNKFKHYEAGFSVDSDSIPF